MAVHLLDGIAVGTDRTRRIIDNREKLLALGQLSAGLTHQLNNPAAATARAAAELREPGRRDASESLPCSPTAPSRRCVTRVGADAAGGGRAGRQVGIASS